MEPKIGHMKSDHRMGRNFLKGTSGDRINALLAGMGANIRKLLAAFWRAPCRWAKNYVEYLFEAILLMRQRPAVAA